MILRRETTKGKPRSFDPAGCAALLDEELARALDRLWSAIADLAIEVEVLEAEQARRAERRRERRR